MKLGMTKINFILRKIGNWIIPPRCFACHTMIQTPMGLCPPCWAQLIFIGAPLCDLCGQPLPPSINAQPPLYCGPCVQNPQDNLTIRSAVIYDKLSRQLILRFKHGDHQELAAFLAGRLIQTAPTWFQQPAILVPVPLHWRRLWRRKFNQSALIAQHIYQQLNSQNPDLQFIPDLLCRHTPTPPQGHLSRTERQENVAKAFRLNQRHQNFIQQKNIILIDDVYTTGATIQACCDILLKAGAAHVQVLTFARVTTIN